MIAILSDIHANIQAFVSVVEDAKRRGADEYWLLGDLVDYGANPNETVELARELNITRFVGGNHDAALFSDVRASKTPHGRAAHEFTKKTLTRDNADWLEPFSRIQLIEALPGTWLVHGTPEDPYWGKVCPECDAEEWNGELERLGGQRLLVGHTHVQFIMALPGGGVIFNPGSVGQPRNGCPDAQYMLYDGERFLLCQTPYDIPAAACAIRAAGLPEYLAERLSAGK